MLMSAKGVSPRTCIRGLAFGPCLAPPRRGPAAAMWGLAALLSGCAAGPNFAPPKPDVPPTWSRTALAAGSAGRTSRSPGAAGGGAGNAAGATRGASGARAIDTSAPEIAEWWSGFEDPTLTSLIEEARAQRQATAAGLWPTLAANASFTRQRFSLNTPNGAVFGLAGGGNLPGLPPGISITNPFNQYQL